MLITDPSTPGGVVDATRAALAAAPAGSVAVQLRDKSATPRRLAELAHALAELTRPAGAMLLLNDRADVARAVGADGVHLPQGGMAPGDVRRVMGTEALVGVSCHDARDLARAEREGADYASLAPFAPVPGKGPTLGPERFAALASATSLPLLALGGIDAAQLPATRAAGAYGVAVIRAVYRAPDPAMAVGRLLQGLAATAPPDG